MAFERARQRGAQARLADHIGCQSAYISMVLRDRSQLSLEQANAAAEFFQLTMPERHFFLLMVQRERAGTAALRRYFDEQIAEVLSNRNNLASRLEYQNVLSEEQRAQYYSAWYYAAVHIGLTIPTLRTVTSLSDYLELSIIKVQQVLDFLVQTGLATKRATDYLVGPTSLHTSKVSPFATQAHVNWRLQSLIALQKPREQNFHYSSIVSLSEGDLGKIREAMIRAIEDIRSTVKESPEEDLYIYSMDLFGLKAGIT